MKIHLIYTPRTKFRGKWTTDRAGWSVHVEDNSGGYSQPLPAKNRSAGITTLRRQARRVLKNWPSGAAENRNWRKLPANEFGTSGFEYNGEARKKPAPRGPRVGPVDGRQGKLESSGGVYDCACRDCFDVSYGGKGSFCNSCKEAGCTGKGECKRDDAYGVSDNPTQQITPDDIRALMIEAGSAGDVKMVAICHRALEGSARAMAECRRIMRMAKAMAGPKKARR